MRESEQFYVIDGVKYIVKRPGSRPNLKQLTKDGVIMRIDYEKRFEWLCTVMKLHGSEPKNLKPTYDKINGLWIKKPEGDVLVKVSHIHPKDKETYCLDCYDMWGTKSEEKICEMRVLANIANMPVKYVVAPEYYVNEKTQIERERVWFAAQVASTIFIGARIYMNLTKYRVYDEITGTYGSRIVDIDPIFFLGKDILLDSNG